MMNATNVDKVAVAARPLLEFTSMATSTVLRRPMSSVGRRSGVATAWQLVCQGDFEARHDVRDHVTDLVAATMWKRLAQRVPLRDGHDEHSDQVRHRRGSG
ncbi:hypothetical protein V7S43_001575 [Phytophthora oleae]|uniref:Uncharacterized protein n=1 Tax=Phytophthora oleae TaxID=2107226 RepID=A0ABD3G436_9STRA